MSIKMPYGEFKNKEIEDIPSPYLKWLAENFNNENICEAADKEWQWREKHNEHFYKIEEE